ncbi:glycosyltransferase family 2 protein [Lactobacillus xylocopicola]|uniref:Glycosyl transferase n=1 Tax=Lactobacillus xylocopicola TaxID=2976676 RepID=A0ABM8BF88_9LACO|nr:glycosyltransferase [Lactobacillus xylocopicola]BDR59930.1 glycosyl transferase [Lactobacillus xylocopicola]
MSQLWQICSTILNILFWILISYPILGSIAWLVGTVCYKYLYKGNKLKYPEFAHQDEPLVSIVIPAHNEEVCIEATVTYMLTELTYSNYEVLVVDDYSTDRTPFILQKLQEKYPNLRVIRIKSNKGKAHALNVALAFVRGEFILSNDADTVPEPDALQKYLRYFTQKGADNIAAITANMNVLNRTKLITKSQTVEFSSIVGIIKRVEQGVFGGVYAYSGANTMYRKSAVMDVGLFRQDRATEDISAAWDQQLNGWFAKFAPDIAFYTSVPETAGALYAQRKRWAKGGIEVWLTNFKKVLCHPFANIGQTLMFFDQTFSILWAFFFWISIIASVVLIILNIRTGNLPYILTLAAVFLSFGIISAVIQLAVALIIDSQASKLRYLLFAPLYIIWWWIVTSLTIVVSFIPAVYTIRHEGSGTWNSPNRV